VKIMDGIILINKPKEWTSHDIVNKVKKILNEKVGHTGTLDPMATGVLPLLVGKGTLCSKYLINHNKTYKVKLELGKKTDTADTEGKIVEEKEVTNKMLEKTVIKEVLNKFLGKQEQIPPIYSAIKVNGKKLYEYARKGQTVEIKPRQIEIYSIELLSIDKKLKQIEFEVSCSKGTYIRSLCEDIGNKLRNCSIYERIAKNQGWGFFYNKCNKY
jgi:tRNA pseudouridine synthase B